MTTPPGWYPDQRQTGTDNPIERWWDGSSWTEYTRTPEQAQPAQPSGFGPAPQAGPYGPVGMTGHPPYQPPPRNRRTAVVAAGVAGVLVVGGVTTGIVLSNRGGGDDKEAGRDKHPSASAPQIPGPGGGQSDGGQSDGGQSDEGQSDGGSDSSPTDPPGTAVDRTEGVSLPVPEGWEKSQTQSANNAYITTQPYSCDTSPSHSCVSAGVYTGAGSGSDPKAAAKADISANAKASYGDIKSHKQSKAGKVEVAGQPGYLVRWKLDVAEGADGSVQSVAFVSPVTGKMVIVRFGFDSTAKAPELSVMDDILDGIRAAGPTNGV